MRCVNLQGTTLLVWVTLTDANIVKYSRQKER